MKSCHSSCVFPAYCVPLQPQFQSSCSDLDTYLPLQLLLLEQSGYLRLPLLVYLHVKNISIWFTGWYMGLIRHKNKCQSPTKLKMIMIWVLGRRRRNKNGRKKLLCCTPTSPPTPTTSPTQHKSPITQPRVFTETNPAPMTHHFVKGPVH